MPKPSVFTRKARGLRSRGVAAPMAPVKSGAGIYDGLNEVSGWLRAMNTGLNTTFAGAPELLKTYIRNASLTLHEMMELMTTKLPRENQDVEAYSLLEPKPEPKPDTGVVAALQTLESVYGGNMANPKARHAPAKPVAAKPKLISDLLSLGLISGMHRLQSGRDQTAKALISTCGGLRRAAMDLADAWEAQREIVCENNRHDHQEYQELREALQSDMQQAHAIINSL